MITITELGALGEFVGAIAVVVTLIYLAMQMRADVIDEAHWEGMTHMMIDYTSMAAFQEYWLDRKHWASDDFQEYMDTEVVSVPPKIGVNVPGAY